MGWKPGHYLLLALSLYALVVTWGFYLRGRALSALAPKAGALSPPALAYRLPLPGACLPTRPGDLPGAPRPYRKGVNAGFVFRDGEVCVPVVLGMGVVAVAPGEVLRIDQDHQEPTPEAYQALLERVRNGATPEDMDLLRGLEVWVRHGDGRVSVYAHLKAPYPTLKVGDQVERGDPLGYVGNTGLGGGPPRLLLEIWEGLPDQSPFLFQGLSPEEVLARARAFFGLE